MAFLPHFPEEDMTDDMKRAAESMRKEFGTVLESSYMYWYVPEIQRGSAHLSGGISKSGLIPGRLNHMLNLRVAAINGCPM